MSEPAERWAIDPASDDDTTAIWNPDTGEHICIIQHETPYTDSIVEITESESTAKEERNARLIAAAPALYEACQWYGEQVEALQRHSAKPVNAIAIEAIHAVLSLDGGNRATAALALANGEPKDE